MSCPQGHLHVFTTVPSLRHTAFDVLLLSQHLVLLLSAVRINNRWDGVCGRESRYFTLFQASVKNFSRACTSAIMCINLFRLSLVKAITLVISSLVGWTGPGYFFLLEVRRSWRLPGWLTWNNINFCCSGQHFAYSVYEMDFTGTNSKVPLFDNWNAEFSYMIQFYSK
jgi:hypothetical protein